MAFSVSSKIANLSTKTQQFDRDITPIISRLQGKTISVAEAETIHNRIFETFRKSMAEITQISIEINRQTTYLNQDAMFELTKQVTGYETTLLEKLNTFNDAVLTYCPTAKIEYGEPCIGDKISPEIHTSNTKIMEMLAHSSHIRKIRGDGNCFLSSFTTRLLENLVEKEQIEGFITPIFSDGINAPVLKEELLTTLLSLAAYPSQLQIILKDNHKVLPFINYFRQLAAREMKDHKEHYEAFFLSEVEHTYGEKTEGKSYESLVDKYVLRMGVDFSHPMITALCKKLNYPILIIDPEKGAPNGFNTLDGSYAEATFCRDQNHYYVLYPHEEAAQLTLPIQQPRVEAPQLTLPIQSALPDPARLTEIIINCKIPAGHRLFIRGSDNGLSWEVGKPLDQLDNETRVYRSSKPLQDMEYKFLLDDEIWQDGGNNKISKGKIDEANPRCTFTTRITIKLDASQGTPFIRGEGAGLSWGKGIPLRQVDNNTFVFETQNNFEKCEYKIVRNDEIWENGGNRKIAYGKKEELIPQF